MDIDVSASDSTIRPTRPKGSSSRTPSSLHEVVLDYISHTGYLHTARKLAEVKRDREGGEHDDVEMDVGGEGSGGSSARPGLDEQTLDSIEKRYNIINSILNGAIVRTIEALNTHYPAVLSPADPGVARTNGHSGGTNGHTNGTSLSSTPPTGQWATPTPTTNITNGHSQSQTHRSSLPGTEIDHSKPSFELSSYPPHVLLNLHIQQFIESFRLLGPSSPSSPSSSISSLTSSTQLHGSQSLGNGSGSGTLQHALTAASGLHAEASKLDPADRAVYVREITEAGALFAYSDPDSSPVGGFLKQERRIQLARQVNRAILRSQGEPPESLLEQMARRTTASYSILDAKGLDTRPPWSGIEGPEREQLARWWKTQNKQFKLSDFVAQGYN